MALRLGWSAFFVFGGEAFALLLPAGRFCRLRCENRTGRSACATELNTELD
jgi:hypothetical protein